MSRAKGLPIRSPFCSDNTLRVLSPFLGIGRGILWAASPHGSVGVTTPPQLSCPPLRTLAPCRPQSLASPWVSVQGDTGQAARPFPASPAAGSALSPQLEDCVPFCDRRLWRSAGKEGDSRASEFMGSDQSERTRESTVTGIRRAPPAPPKWLGHRSLRRWSVPLGWRAPVQGLGNQAAGAPAPMGLMVWGATGNRKRSKGHIRQTAHLVVKPTGLAAGGAEGGPVEQEPREGRLRREGDQEQGSQG